MLNNYCYREADDYIILFSINLFVYVHCIYFFFFCVYLFLIVIKF